MFRLRTVLCSDDLSALRWTIDYQEDYDFVSAVYRRLGEGRFSMTEVVDLLRREPETLRLNAHIVPHEGWRKSLMADEARNG